MPERRRRIWPYPVGILLVAIVLLVVFWRWDWFIPIVDSQASAALGRKVTVQHLHVSLGRVTTVTADDVMVAQPEGFDPEPPFASAHTLTVSIDVMHFIRARSLSLPLIAVDHADVDAMAKPDGKNNWTLGSSKAGGSGSSSNKSGGLPQIGDLRITDSHVRFVDPKLKAKVDMAVSTRDASGQSDSRLIVEAKGTYAEQPITGHLVAGALLSLENQTQPYPIDLRIENGPTKVALVGTVHDPLHFKGADLKLSLSGPDMSLLLPLTGIPIPPTPNYSIAGHLNYDAGSRAVKFDDFEGRVGSSDLGGDIAVALSGAKPDVSMNLHSHKVDLADLGGFVGTAPGRKDTPDQPPADREKVARTEKTKQFFPDKPINFPVVEAANVHLRYDGEHIIDKYVPLDDIQVRLDLVNGKIELHPLKFGVGKGAIDATVALDAAEKPAREKAEVKFERVSLARIMSATHSFAGNGTIGGGARLDTYGNSFADMMGNGNGDLKMTMTGGGQISALLVDIAGLEFGNAILSALGLPQKAEVQCFVTDFDLHNGLLHTQELLLQTSEARSVGKGSINLRDEKVDLTLTTRSTHFSVGSLPGPINIGGTLSSPSVLPGKEVAARAGAAVGLGILAAPLALLPTVQFGVGEGDACAKAEAVERRPDKVIAPRPTSHSGRR